MSYDISFKARIENTYMFVNTGDCSANITWNVRDIIVKSTGLEWKNEANNGLVKDVIKKIEKGYKELSENPEKYKKYEAENGWGTVEDTKIFFKTIIEEWEWTKKYTSYSDYLYFWIE